MLMTFQKESVPARPWAMAAFRNAVRATKVFSGGGANYVKPFGDHVGDLVNAPVHLDWQLRGWDISFGGRGKVPVKR